MIENRSKETTGGGSRKEMGVEKRKSGKKISVWNIAGVRRQDIGTWEFIKDFDFVSLCETWVMESEWRRMKNIMPVSHEWECIFAKREKKKGRAKGGFILGKRKNGG